MSGERHTKTLGNGTWERVVALLDCSYYAINVQSVGDSFDKCCNPNDESTWQLGISQHAVLAPPVGQPRSESGQRWDSGDIITWVRSSSPLNLYFLK